MQESQDKLKSFGATSIEEDRHESSQGNSWKLLLAACSRYLNPGGYSSRESLCGRVDWNALPALANQHGVSSLLHQALPGLDDFVPAATLETLHAAYQQNVHKTLFLARELIRILDCLEGLGAEALAYKGIVLAEMYYGDMAMRPAGDLDVFVHAKDVARMKSAVRDLGYTPRLAIPENACASYLWSGYECTFDGTSGKNLLELQWALQPRFYAADYDMQGLFARAVEARAAGRAVKTPCAEDLLLVLSLHAAKHAWGRLIWLCDIARILRQENLNWTWIEEQSRELHIERILHITLGLIHRFFRVEIPTAAQEAVAADRATQALIDEIASSVRAGVEYEEEKISYFRLMMRLRERRWDRVRFAARLAFTPGPGEWQAVRLPQPLFPLYRIVRLARLAARIVRQPGSHAG